MNPGGAAAADNRIPGDPWVVFLASAPRAAMQAARKMQAAQRRLDGPFQLWDGKAGNVRCVILIPLPGGSDAWYAAARLAVRRYAPTLIVGVTPIMRGTEGDPSEWFAAEEVLDWAPFQTGDFQERLALASGGQAGDMSGLAGQLRQRQERLRPPGGGLAWIDAWKSSLSQKRIDFGALACCNKTRLEREGGIFALARAAGAAGLDQESSGLAQAATECQLPWAVVGPCIPPKVEFDGFPRGRDAAASWNSIESMMASVLESALGMMQFTHGIWA